MALNIKKAALSIWDEHGNKQSADMLSDETEVIPVGLKEQVQKNTDDIKKLSDKISAVGIAEGMMV